MKHKLAIAVLASVLFSGSAAAGGYYGGGYGGHHHHHDSGRWVAPFIIGGAIGYAISESNRPRTVYVQPQPVYVAPPPPPPVYVEPARTAYWYYCPTSDAYYPYVGSCVAPWVRILPN